MLEEEEGLDLRRYIGIVLTHWWLLVLLASVGAAAGFYLTPKGPPVYEAEATILVQARGSSFFSDAGDFAQSQRLASTYQKLITSRPFFERVSRNDSVPFTPHELRSMVSAWALQDPPVLEVKIRHTDPEIAAATGQTVAEEFIDYTIERRLAEIARVQSVAAAQGVPDVQNLVSAQFTIIDSLSLLEPVGWPSAAQGAPTSRNIALGVIVGLVLAMGAAMLHENLTDTVRFPDQLNRRFGVTSLGNIFKWSKEDIQEGGLMVWEASNSSYAEAFRQIRTNFLFATTGDDQSGNVFVVSSPGPEEGKSTILSNLAVAMAQTGKRIVVVDGDMRRPSLHRLLSAERREPGLSNFLADQTTDPDSLIQGTPVEGLKLIASGPSPPNPAEMLGSQTMTTLLSHLKTEYDMVLVDSPPMLPVADASIIAAQVDGAIMVADAFGTKSSSLQAALDSLRNTRARILGVIINKLKPPRFGFGYGYPAYYYQSYYRYYPNSDMDQVDGAGRFPLKVRRRAKAVWSRLRGH